VNSRSCPRADFVQFTHSAVSGRRDLGKGGTRVADLTNMMLAGPGFLPAEFDAVILCILWLVACSGDEWGKSVGTERELSELFLSL
jgi:hypothetical protein